MMEEHRLGWAVLVVGRRRLAEVSIQIYVCVMGNLAFEQLQMCLDPTAVLLEHGGHEANQKLNCYDPEGITNCTE